MNVAMGFRGSRVKDCWSVTFPADDDMIDTFFSWSTELLLHIGSMSLFHGFVDSSRGDTERQAMDYTIAPIAFVVLRATPGFSLPFLCYPF